MRAMTEPYTLILLRHGQSEWNELNLFTGWVDVRLTEQGQAEARRGGELMAAQGILPDVLHTSLLSRAIQTANIALDAADRLWIPVKRTWRLNERHYGALQGLNKKETAEQHGDEQVLAWRRGYAVRPPALAADDTSRPDADLRYAGINGLPDTESLADTLLRVTEWWDETLVPLLRSDSRLLIVAHGNSLRAMVKFLDQMSEDEILEFNIPTGIPMVYEFEDNLSVIRRYFLADDDKLQSAVDEVRNQASTKAS